MHTKQLFGFTLVIALALISVSCQPVTSPTQSAQAGEIQDIRVQVVEPVKANSKVEQFPLPNCGGNVNLEQSLGSSASAQQSATVSGTVKPLGGGEVAIPATVKLKLEIQVELAYQKTFESANSRLDSIKMSAAPGTHIVYTIVWEDQTFNSIVEYAQDGKVYEAPYTYKLSVPKVDKSYKVQCPGNSSNPGSSSLPATQVVIEPVPNNATVPAVPQSPVQGVITLPASSACQCFGKCWQYDENAHTMTWTGPTNGCEDIWQGDNLSLSRIRSGWTAIFGPVSVPGEVEACVLTVNGQQVATSCNGALNLVSVEANQTYQFTSADPVNGGFRWKPAAGYGYRTH